MFFWHEHINRDHAAGKAPLQLFNFMSWNFRKLKNCCLMRMESYVLMFRKEPMSLKLEESHNLYNHLQNRRATVRFSVFCLCPPSWCCNTTIKLANHVCHLDQVPFKTHWNWRWGTNLSFCSRWLNTCDCRMVFTCKCYHRLQKCSLLECGKTSC